jgi:hypothetical protein
LNKVLFKRKLPPPPPACLGQGDDVVEQCTQAPSACAHLGIRPPEVSGLIRHVNSITEFLFGRHLNTEFLLFSRHSLICCLCSTWVHLLVHVLLLQPRLLQFILQPLEPLPRVKLVSPVQFPRLLRHQSPVPTLFCVCVCVLRVRFWGQFRGPGFLGLGFRV